MSYIYHILDKIPAIEADEMQVEYETLAQSLVKSGRLRIDTGHHTNFARFSDPQKNITMMFSKEELEDERLLTLTKEALGKVYASSNAKAMAAKIDRAVADLKNQIKKLIPVDPEVQVKLTRLFVQSAHPIVIKWILYDNVEVFISYSYNIGDMMDVASWQSHGSNSGMQSTDGKSVAIFVSCGGDPFAETSEKHPTIGDGWPAVARLQVIAGQEIGHFADIMRDSSGRQIGRHSANFSGTQATKHAAKARKDDIKTCDSLLQDLIQKAQLDKLADIEKQLQFYERQNLSGSFGLRLKNWFYRRKLLTHAVKNNRLFIKKFKQDKYIALMVMAMIKDMQMNLTPGADVYKRSSLEAEEAIACIEALARVPQQVMKWGHITVMATMTELYKIYYYEVIPSLERNYSLVTGQTYKRDYSYPKKSIFKRIKEFFFRRKPAFVPVRQLL